MASSCVKNMGVSSDSFQRYGWLSRRMFLSREDEPSKSRSKAGRSKPTDLVEPEIQETATEGDFEFILEDPVTMLPADELFSNGKLMPLHFSTLKQQQKQPPLSEPRLLETTNSCPTTDMDPYLLSPRAPRCSSRWRELLGLKNSSQQHPKSESKPPKSLKHFLHRTTKSSSSLNLPLLKDSDCESVSISSSRLSLSSSSSLGHEHDDLPRLSLDSDKSNPNPFAPGRNINPPRTGRSQIRSNSWTSRGQAGESRWIVQE